MAKKEERKTSAAELDALLNIAREEIYGLKHQRETFVTALQELEQKRDTHKAAFYEERKAKDVAVANEEHVREVLGEVRDELAGERKKNSDVWSSIYDLLIDSDVLSHLRGWYWSAERKEPIYVDGIGEDGLTGFSLGFFAGKFNGSVTDTFDFKDLVRIDVNVATELEY